MRALSVRLVSVCVRFCVNPLELSRFTFYIRRRLWLVCGFCLGVGGFFARSPVFICMYSPDCGSREMCFVFSGRNPVWLENDVIEGGKMRKGKQISRYRPGVFLMWSFPVSAWLHRYFVSVKRGTFWNTKWKRTNGKKLNDKIISNQLITIRIRRILEKSLFLRDRIHTAETIWNMACVVFQILIFPNVYFTNTKRSICNYSPAHSGGQGLRQTKTISAMSRD